jgi:hypothetical protein
MRVAAGYLIPVLVVMAVACSSGGGGSTEDTGAKDVAAETAAPETSSDAAEVVPDVADVVAEIAADVPDVFHTGVSPKGYGEFCFEYSDCEEFGLLCFNFGAEDPDPICTMECDSYQDCSIYHVCDYKYGIETPLKVCMAAKYCSECEEDSQCLLSGMECIHDVNGVGFCSNKCAPGLMSCEGGSGCMKDEERGEWYCKPHYGSCVGDGKQCAPCKVEEDCPNDKSVCFSSFYTKERFCTNQCGAAGDCAKGTTCFDIGEELGICLMAENNVPLPSCHVHTQDFCQECRGDWECKDGFVCYVGPANIGFYCTKECKASTDCEVGMQCKSQFAVDTGMPSGKYACALKNGVECKNLIK